MLSGESSDKRQLCFLLALTETACINVKALVWSESGSTEAAVGNNSELRVYWAPADGNATVIFVAVSLLAKFLKMSHTKVIKYSLTFHSHPCPATPHWEHSIRFYKKILHRENHFKKMFPRWWQQGQYSRAGPAASSAPESGLCHFLQRFLQGGDSWGESATAVPLSLLLLVKVAQGLVFCSPGTTLFSER